MLGSGHRHLYPRAHARLTERILATGGAVISEMWPATQPAAGTFPRRNRLISGLSSATIVVEAGIRSGALITAALALKQGREAFFVPGPIDEPRSAGCLHWLRTYSGVARIVAGIPELIEDLGLLRDEPIEPGRVRRPSLEAELVELGDTGREVARALLATQGTLDELVAATGHPPATVLSAITLLELRGLVTTTYGYNNAGETTSVTDGAASLNVRGTVRAGGFSGNGAGLTNVNAATLGGLGSSSFWKTTGNTGTAPGVNFIGTTDGQNLLIRGGFVGIGRANAIGSDRRRSSKRRWRRAIFSRPSRAASTESRPRPTSTSWWGSRASTSCTGGMHAASWPR